MEIVLFMDVQQDNVVHNTDSNTIFFQILFRMCAMILVVVQHRNIVKELYNEVIVKLEDVLMAYVVRNLDSVVIRLNIAIKHH